MLSRTPKRQRRRLAAPGAASTARQRVLRSAMTLPSCARRGFCVCCALRGILQLIFSRNTVSCNQNRPKSAEDAGHGGVAGPVAGCGRAGSAVPAIPGQLRAPRRWPDGQPSVLAVEAALLVHLAQPPPSTNGGRLAAKSRAPVRFGRAGWPFAPMGAPKTPLCEVSRGGSGEAAVREAELHVDVRHLLPARGTAPPTARALPLHPLDLYLVGTVSAPATRWAKLPS